MNKITPWIFAGLCMSSQVTLAADQIAMTFDASTNDATPSKLVDHCLVSIAGIRDERNNKESIGVEFRPLLSGDPIPWVSAALQTLQNYGYKVIDGKTETPGAIVINASLIRSYTYHGPMRINGTVALDTQMTLPSGEKLNRKYRAAGSKANMAGSDSEYVTALNYAINGLVEKMAKDMQPMCKAPQSQMLSAAPSSP
jgi:hypothetical protein